MVLVTDTPSVTSEEVREACLFVDPVEREGSCELGNAPFDFGAAVYHRRNDCGV